LVWGVGGGTKRRGQKETVQLGPKGGVIGGKFGRSTQITSPLRKRRLRPKSIKRTKGCRGKKGGRPGRKGRTIPCRNAPSYNLRTEKDRKDKTESRKRDHLEDAGGVVQRKSTKQKKVANVDKKHGEALKKNSSEILN